MYNKEPAALRALVERQAEFVYRSPSDVRHLLSDSGRKVANRRAADVTMRKRVALAFGNWLAYDLGLWDWFINPITFRDRHPDLETNPKTGARRQYRMVGRWGRVKLFVPDPRLKGWTPARIEPGSPDPRRALDEIFDWLAELQQAAGNPIFAVVAEEFGRIGGRFHCHLLIRGVAHLRRDVWWRVAFERFGRTRIELFDPERGAAFYAAKYAAKAFGALHFVGAPSVEEFTARISPGVPTGGRDVAVSAAVPRAAYRLSFESIFGSRWNRGKR